MKPAGPVNCTFLMRIAIYFLMLGVSYFLTIKRGAAQAYKPGNTGTLCLTIPRWVPPHLDSRGVLFSVLTSICLLSSCLFVWLVSCQLICLSACLPARLRACSPAYSFGCLVVWLLIRLPVRQSRRISI